MNRLSVILNANFRLLWKYRLTKARVLCFFSKGEAEKYYKALIKDIKMNPHKYIKVKVI